LNVIIAFGAWPPLAVARLFTLGIIRNYMETRIRYRVRTRRHRKFNLFWRRSRHRLNDRKIKWVVLALAFVIGLHFNSEIKRDIARADGVVIISNGIPEPSTVSLMICSGAALLFFTRKKQKNP
jgi:hypothetical protein